METISLIKKIPKSKKVIIPLTQFKSGQDVEILLFVNILSEKKEGRPFDMEEWAKKWSSDFGDDIRSSDVENFTGRNF
jgi:hypothetical protein